MYRSSWEAFTSELEFSSVRYSFQTFLHNFPQLPQVAEIGKDVTDKEGRNIFSEGDVILIHSFASLRCALGINHFDKEIHIPLGFPYPVQICSKNYKDIIRGVEELLYIYPEVSCVEALDDYFETSVRYFNRYDKLNIIKVSCNSITFQRVDGKLMEFTVHCTARFAPRRFELVEEIKGGWFFIKDILEDEKQELPKFFLFGDTGISEDGEDDIYSNLTDCSYTLAPVKLMRTTDITVIIFFTKRFGKIYAHFCLEGFEISLKPTRQSMYDNRPFPLENYLPRNEFDFTPEIQYILEFLLIDEEPEIYMKHYNVGYYRRFVLNSSDNTVMQSASSINEPRAKENHFEESPRNLNRFLPAFNYIDMQPAEPTEEYIEIANIYSVEKNSINSGSFQQMCEKTDEENDQIDSQRNQGISSIQFDELKQVRLKPVSKLPDAAKQTGTRVVHSRELNQKIHSGEKIFSSEITESREGRYSKKHELGIKYESTCNVLPTKPKPYKAAKSSHQVQPTPSLTFPDPLSVSSVQASEVPVPPSSSLKHLSDPPQSKAKLKLVLPTSPKPLSASQNFEQKPPLFSPKPLSVSLQPTPNAQMTPSTFPKPLSASPQPIAIKTQIPPSTSPKPLTTPPHTKSKALLPTSPKVPLASPQPTPKPQLSPKPLTAPTQPTAKAQVPPTFPKTFPSSNLKSEPKVSSPTSPEPLSTTPHVTRKPKVPLSTSPEPLSTTLQVTRNPKVSSPASPEPLTTTPQVARKPKVSSPTSPEPLSTTPQVALKPKVSSLTTPEPLSTTPHVTRKPKVSSPTSPEPLSTTPHVTRKPKVPLPTSPEPLSTTPQVTLKPKLPLSTSPKPLLINTQSTLKPKVPSPTSKKHVHASTLSAREVLPHSSPKPLSSSSKTTGKILASTNTSSRLKKTSNGPVSDSFLGLKIQTGKIIKDDDIYEPIEGQKGTPFQSDIHSQGHFNSTLGTQSVHKPANKISRSPPKPSLGSTIRADKIIEDDNVYEPIEGPKSTPSYQSDIHPKKHVTSSFRSGSAYKPSSKSIRSPPDPNLGLIIQSEHIIVEDNIYEPIEKLQSGKSSKFK